MSSSSLLSNLNSLVLYSSSSIIFKKQDGFPQRDWKFDNIWVERNIQKLLSLGHFELLKLIHAKIPLQMTSCTFNAAARRGELAVCEWLHKEGVCCTHHAVEWAAQGGHTAMVQWLLDNFFPEAGAPTLTSSRSSCSSQDSCWEAEGQEEGLDHLPEWFTAHPQWNCRAEEVVTAFRFTMEKNGGTWTESATEEMHALFELSREQVKSLQACIFHPEPTWQLPSWFLERDPEEQAEITQFFTTLASYGGWTMEVDLYARQRWDLSGQETMKLAEVLITVPGGVCQQPLVTAVLLEAIGHGHMDLVEQLLLRGSLPQGDSLQVAKDSAAGKGHLHTVKWLDQHCSLGITTSPKALNEASRGGYLGTVEWLHYLEAPCTTAAMNGAAGAGHLSVVEFLHSHRDEGCTKSAMNTAIRNGHLPMVEWLHQHRTESCSKKAMDWAAEKGYLSVLKWLHQNRVAGFSSQIGNLAAANGHVDVLEWLTFERIRQPNACSKYAMDTAARLGHLDVLNFLLENNLVAGREKITKESFFGAARQGHFEILQWLYRHFADQAKANQGITLAYSLLRNRYKIAQWILLQEDPFSQGYLKMIQEARQEMLKAGKINLFDQFLHQEVRQAVRSSLETPAEMKVMDDPAN
mmetsp:Transcript_17745/g.22995  ORF Transcript_17745/g.22995 Transcript_17745/m.22995 type:complete len:635 (+) Transcript_17745:124-2028(+)